MPTPFVPKAASGVRSSKALTRAEEATTDPRVLYPDGAAVLDALQEEIISVRGRQYIMTVTKSDYVLAQSFAEQYLPRTRAVAIVRRLFSGKYRGVFPAYRSDIVITNQFMRPSFKWLSDVIDAECAQASVEENKFSVEASTVKIRSMFDLEEL